MEPKIQRFCWFDTAVVYASQYPYGTIWKTFRAKEGMKLILAQAICISNNMDGNVVNHFQIYEGEIKARNWGSFPLIYDQSTLGMATLNENMNTYTIDLQGYETKSLTMSIRNTSISAGYSVLIILFYYEVPMTRLETFEYAVKQPKYKYRHGGLRTLDRFEDDI